MVSGLVQLAADVLETHITTNHVFCFTHRYGFNSGSALIAGRDAFGDTLAVKAAANTPLAAGAAGVSSLFVDSLVKYYRTGETHYDLIVTMNGALSGLVSITAACGVVEPWAAPIIGGLGGVFYLLASWSLVTCRLDDAVDAIPVHATNGIWGMIGAGLFASPSLLMKAYGKNDHPGLIYSGDFTLLGAQMIGILFISIWTVSIMLPFFTILEKMGLFRSDAMEEVYGLDHKYFGGLQMGGGEQMTEDEVKKLSNNLLHFMNERNKDDDELIKKINDNKERV
jgi:Amt family ammonium transporter